MKTANLKLENIHEDSGSIYGYQGQTLVELYTKDDAGDDGMVKAGYIRTGHYLIKQDGQMVSLWIRGDVYDTLTI